MRRKGEARRDIELSRKELKVRTTLGEVLGLNDAPVVADGVRWKPHARARRLYK